MVYFDNAATSGKKPQSVINAVTFALNNLSANPGRSGHDLSVKTADEVYNVRKKVADFFGCDGAENVVFTLNCTHSINCVLKGCLGRGEHVVISNLEHNAVMRPLKAMGANFSMATVSNDANETVENFKKSIKPNTKLVFTSGASNVTGKILPIEKIGKMCKEKGIRFGVDAAQIAGILPINMQKMNIDYLCIAPHKSLYAPMGIGILICRKPIEKTIVEGGTGTDSLDFLQPQILPEGLESGTINVPGIMGVGAGLDFVKKTGLENIYKHEFSLLRMLYENFRKNSKIILYTKPPEFKEYAPVLPFNLADCESFKLADFLNQNAIAVRGGLHCAPTAHASIGTLPHGAARASFGVFNQPSEVKLIAGVLSDEKIIKKLQKSY